MFENRFPSDVLHKRSNLLLCLFQAFVIINDRVAEGPEYLIADLVIHDAEGLLPGISAIRLKPLQAVLPRCINIPHFAALVTEIF